MMYPRIRALREDSDLSQTKIAMELNCSQQTLIALSKIYNTSVDYLLGLTDVREPYVRVR